jgi:hypothetical protein
VWPRSEDASPKTPQHAAPVAAAADLADTSLDTPLPDGGLVYSRAVKMNHPQTVRGGSICESSPPSASMLYGEEEGEEESWGGKCGGRRNVRLRRVAWQTSLVRIAMPNVSTRELV